MSSSVAQAAPPFQAQELDGARELVRVVEAFHATRAFAVGNLWGSSQAFVLAFLARHAAGPWLVIASTDSEETNARVAVDARAAGALVNVVDRPSLCDFLVPAEGTGAAAENALAQAAALMAGKNASEAQRRFDGNRPSSTIMFKAIDPHTMGQLLALYEHKVFVQGIIWNINSFDQWGVELGKEIARTLAQPAAAAMAGMDASTKALLQRLRDWRG